MALRVISWELFEYITTILIDILIDKITDTVYLF